MSEHPLKGRYPGGAVDTAISALEAVRPDYPEGGAIRHSVDEALDHPLRPRDANSHSETA